MKRHSSAASSGTVETERSHSRSPSLLLGNLKDHIKLPAYYLGTWEFP